jgi:hypothetical protein
MEGGVLGCRGAAATADAAFVEWRGQVASRGSAAGFAGGSAQLLQRSGCEGGRDVIPGRLAELL